MSFYKVHNLREGGKSGNWLEYWEKQPEQKPVSVTKLVVLNKRQMVRMYN